MSYTAFAKLKEHVELETLKAMTYEEINKILTNQKDRIDKLENDNQRLAVQLKSARGEPLSVSEHLLLSTI